MSTHFSGPVVSTNGFTGALTGAVVATSATIGSGTAIIKIIKGTVAVDPPSLATKVSGVVTLTITGAAVGDIVQINPGAAGFTAGIVLTNPWVSAADTVKVTVVNTTAGTLDESSLTCDYILIRS